MVSENLDDVLCFDTLRLKVVEVGGCKKRGVGKEFDEEPDAQV